MEGFVTLASFAAFGFGLYALVKLAHWMFAPLERRVLEMTPVRRYQVVDALALMVMLQYTLAPAMGLLRAIEARPASLTIWGLVAFVVTALVWWAGVELISRAGVAEPRRRFCFLVVGIPATFATSLLLSFGVPAILIVAVATMTPWLITLAIPLSPLPWSCRQLMEWIVSAPAP